MKCLKKWRGKSLIRTANETLGKLPWEEPWSLCCGKFNASNYPVLYHVFILLWIWENFNTLNIHNLNDRILMRAHYEDKCFENFLILAKTNYINSFYASAFRNRKDFSLKEIKFRCRHTLKSEYLFIIATALLAAEGRGR